LIILGVIPFPRSGSSGSGGGARYITGSQTGDLALGIGFNATLATLTLYASVYKNIQAARYLYQSARATGEIPGALNRTKTILTADSEVIGESSRAARAGLVFDLALTWG